MVKYISNPLKKSYSIVFTAVALLLFLTSCKENQGDYTALTQGESCVQCHTGMTGFSKFHDPKTIGCAACHLGNTKSMDKEISHQGMILIPGNLQNAAQTCSSTQCHANELDRISKSLMTTNSGIISIDKLLFDEVHHTDTLFHITQLKHSAADVHLKNKCGTCHLGNEKKQYAATTEKTRGGGCLACHLNYENGSKPNIHDNIHPQINLNVGNDKCFGCHSRSGRISTNYEGWSETLLQPEDVKGKTGYRQLMDGRIFEKTTADVHHKIGMLCIDCHTSQEIMGDGKTYKHQANAVKIQCKDCHTAGKAPVKKTLMDYISVKDYALRGYKNPEYSFLVTEKDNITLVNTRVDQQGNAYLTSKISKKEHLISNTCKKDEVHGNVSCSMCHTAWAPTCIGCHTDYDPRIVNADKTKGRWVEHVAEFGYLPPTIGVKKEGKTKTYMPAIPGMIMTLDRSQFDQKSKEIAEKFVRWYAPNAAHTTVKEARDCASCHSNPQALGYGRGILSYIKTGTKAEWKFESYYANSPQDQLPQDAWIGFLQNTDAKKMYSSHDYFKPLDLGDQKKMLQVGACLQCHGTDVKFLNRMVAGEYQKMLKSRKTTCVIP